MRAGPSLQRTHLDVAQLHRGPVSLSVAKIAAKFGSRHVHIVTNSKGGLFTREFLTENGSRNPNVQTGVISVTTLETPHHGDLAVL
jgi:triacylglycerol esterase/lipase EstA (alpha/beta hydrolase family)